MKITYKIKFVLILSLIGFVQNSIGQQSEQPNIIIIHTDEHNLRTLGSYRATMSQEQAEIWGKGNIVETPNIDKLANEGTLALNWYATSPVCTPSRASMITGLYPVATGSPKNDMPLNDNVITFGHILKDNGYATSYVGKWHLDGEDKPGFAPERKFGFDHNRYMINRGHWKVLKEDADGLKVDQERNKNGGAVFVQDKATETSFTTDFLTTRALKILEQDKNKPFCLMLSIPDPHGPDQVRAPYNTMYKYFVFEMPKTSNVNLETAPEWLNLKGKKNRLNQKKFQRNMAQYFGMVKCIDDNVGRLLNFLKENNLEDNTIVIFTSDHGDLLGEHGKLNKGLPYETSARVPFLIRYPNKIKAGKQIEKAYTMADFAPTILGLMGIDLSSYNFHGINAAKDFKSKKTIVDDRIVYITNANQRWVAAVNNQYKLVLSPKDTPWLFDLKNDPNELVNLYTNPKYKQIADKLEKELYAQMKEYNEPLPVSKIKK